MSGGSPGGDVDVGALLAERCVLLESARGPIPNVAEPAARLASIEEQHTASGAHRKIETPFLEWIPADALEAAAALTESEAFALLPECVRPTS